MESDPGMKAMFYANFTPIYRKNLRTTKLITNDKYNEIVKSLQLWDEKQPHEKNDADRRYKQKYKLQNAMQSTSLVRFSKNGEWLRVATFENVFDIIHSIHFSFIRHPRDKEKNQKIINKKYYGVPISAVEEYLRLCKFCIANKKKQPKAQQNPLKMILMNEVGQRCQVDLIDMSSQPDPSNNNKWILRYVDHLSGYGYVRCMPTKESRNTANALVEIISESIVPEILQSDNGSEFLGEYVYLLSIFVIYYLQ
jgi:hypothetical protein